MLRLRCLCVCLLLAGCGGASGGKVWQASELLPMWKTDAKKLEAMLGKPITVEATYTGGRRTGLFVESLHGEVSIPLAIAKPSRAQDKYDDVVFADFEIVSWDKRHVNLKGWTADVMPAGDVVYPFRDGQKITVSGTLRRHSPDSLSLAIADATLIR